MFCRVSRSVPTHPYQALLQANVCPGRFWQFIGRCHYSQPKEQSNFQVPATKAHSFCPENPPSLKDSFPFLSGTRSTSQHAQNHSPVVTGKAVGSEERGNFGTWATLHPFEPGADCWLRGRQWRAKEAWVPVPSTSHYKSACVPTVWEYNPAWLPSSPSSQHRNKLWFVVQEAFFFLPFKRLMDIAPWINKSPGEGGGLTDK